MKSFTLPNVDDTHLSLDDFRDRKGVILIFSCNHCPYVIAYENRMKALHEEFAPLGIPVLAISANDPMKYPQDSFENMKVRAKEKAFPFPYLFDESQEVARAFGAERTPHAYFIVPEAAQWKVLYKGAIDDNHKDAAAVSSRYLATYVHRFLQAGAAAYQETPAVGCTIKWK